MLYKLLLEKIISSSLSLNEASDSKLITKSWRRLNFPKHLQKLFLNIFASLPYCDNSHLTFIYNLFSNLSTQDTLRDECDPSEDCLRNCCVSPIIAPMYFVVFVLLAQFVLVNVVVAVLMKHLEESHRNMEEDEDFEIDMEIAREIAAEKAG